MPIRSLWYRTLPCVLACSLFLAPAGAQERFSLFVPTSHPDVERMVKFANLRDGDLVIDLGSGDGRIVFEALRRHPGVRGRGIEIDKSLVAKSTAQAKTEGLAERVQFIHQNAFDADLAKADVIFMWLFPELMRMLRPKIMREARPGTRVVTRTWDLGAWPPDATLGTDIFLWIVPARVDGDWTWELPLAGGPRAYSAYFEQTFQKAEGAARSGNRRNVFENLKLSGDQISFTLDMTVPGVGLVDHRFEGRVRGDTIEGTATVRPSSEVNPVTVPWRAKRTKGSPFFAYTGVDMD
ncbi:MAG TPA: class I SAM-dependent methyltransferase [Burkholderiales bacterium]|nr:class I SAM-dependent methyltransferase [Burkholderiales bacterium]